MNLPNEDRRRFPHHVIDADRHLLEPPNAWVDYIDPRYRDRAPRLAGRYSVITIVDGIQSNSRRRPFAGLSDQELEDLEYGLWTDNHWRSVYRHAIEGDFDAPSYVADMDREGIEAAVCFGTAQLYFNWIEELDPDYSRAICRAYNDWVHDYCSYAPDRLFPIGSVPMQDPRMAAEEAIRCVEELGMVGIMLRPNPFQSHSWHDTHFDFFYDAMEELGKPICFHEGASTDMTQARLPYGSSFWVRHCMSHPFEGMLACLSICGLGVVERHPRLKVFFAESTSGWALPWLSQLDRLWERSEEKPVTSCRPSSYFRANCMVSAEAEEETLGIFERNMGPHNVMWASDYPHPDQVLKFPDTLTPLMTTTEVSEPFKRKMLWENPDRFFGLGLGPAASGGDSV